MIVSRATILTILFCGVAPAAVITGTVISSDGGAAPGSRAIETLLVNNGDEINTYGAGWYFAPENLDTFEVKEWTLGVGFSYYILPFGTPISQITPPTEPALVTNLVPAPASATQFNIPLGESIFLGFEFNSELPSESRVYGWVELENFGGVVLAIDSATAFDLPGIIVGTTTPIPEPSSSLYLGITSLALFRRRRATRVPSV